jgi:putative ABC transport system permease protein
MCRCPRRALWENRRVLSPRWRKVVRELWGNKVRTLLVVLAIAVGVFSFGSAFITREVLIADMDRQYRAIKPSSITMSISEFDDGLVRWAARQEGVVAAQGRSTASVKLVQPDGKKIDLMLTSFGESEDLSVDRITAEQGVWPPERYSIAFERTSMPAIAAGLGGPVTVETSDGHKYELKVGASVHDLKAIPYSFSLQLTGYVSQKTFDWLGLPHKYNQLDIVVADGIDTIPKLETVADRINDDMQHFGVYVSSVAIILPTEHPAKSSMDATGLILMAMGFFSLFLSGFLVINTVMALLAQQRRQIGIMKAVGGTGRQIAAVYLSMMAAYGVLGLIVALPLGVGLAYVYLMALANFMNINIVNFQISPQVLLLQAVVSVLVPVLASLVPVLGGVRVTVREAMSDYGIAVGPKNLIYRGLMHLRGFPRPILLSLRNTFRSQGRLIMTLCTLGLAGVLFITVINTRGSLTAELSREFQMYDYDADLVLDGNYPEQQIISLAERVPGVVKAEGRSAATVQRVKADGTREANFIIFGLPPGTSFVKPEMKSGRWLQDSDRNAIVLSSLILDDSPDIKVGDELTLESRGKEYKWKVVGIASMISQKFAYAPFKELVPGTGERGTVSSVYITTQKHDGATQSKVCKAVEERFKDRGIKVTQWTTVTNVFETISATFDFFVTFMLAMAAMAALIGALGLTSTLSLNVLERTREIGVMRSIGATSWTINMVVLTEGLLIGLISWAIAVPLAVPTSSLFATAMGETFNHRAMPFVYSWEGVAIWFGIVVVLSFAASLLPARRASSMSVRETLSYE